MRLYLVDFMVNVMFTFIGFSKKRVRHGINLFMLFISVPQESPQLLYHAAGYFPCHLCFYPSFPAADC